MGGASRSRANRYGYGIAEPDDKAKRHLPERLDPLRRTDVSKEWLEQVIQTIVFLRRAPRG